MKAVALLVLVFCCHLLAAQDTTELIRRNGFKSIHLGELIDSIHGAAFKKDITERDEFPAKLYEVENPEYKNIGEVIVKEVKVKTYHDMIYEIKVTTEKDARVMRALEKSFGQATFLPRTTNYKWGTTPLSLSFYVHKHSLELVYRSHPVIRQMYADKGKKVDEISEGF